MEYLESVALRVGGRRHASAFRPAPEAKLDATALEMLVTPEEAVMLDTALEGEARLHALHIKRLTDGTDLAKHFDFVSSLNSRPEGCLCPSEEPDAALVLSVAIKCADLGHSLKPWPLHQQWSHWVTDEFFALGDLERASGVPISALCDREKDVDLPKNQVREDEGRTQGSMESLISLIEGG